MERREWKSSLVYAALLAAALAVGFVGATFFALDDTAYDFMMRRFPPRPWQPQSAILAIDEPTLSAYGGSGGMRRALADALPIVAAAHPKAVVIDIIFADKGSDASVDSRLAAALCATPNLVLSADELEGGWDMPLPEFTCGGAAAVGHVHAAPTTNDSVTRAIPLLKRTDLSNRSAIRQLWSISLEAFRLSRGADIVPSTVPSEPLMAGNTAIPIPDKDDGRLMRIQFLPPGMAIPRVSLKGLVDRPDLAKQLTGKVVFAGVTAITELHDRLITPVSVSRQISGIELHATAFETLAQGLFRTDVRGDVEFLVCLAYAIAIGLAFRFLPGWWAYSGGVLVLAASMLVPYLFFIHRLVFPFSTSVSVAWAAFLTAAAYYHLVVRRNWHIERASRTRYQQAMQFVTHEMRTPLSAIQGSSELISRFPLTEDKRKQVAQLINSESKRLARMVEVFLSVERLSAGQMELKREIIEVKPVVEVCVERSRPLADRKQITLTLEPIPDGLLLSGDRELMEYACYNLLTNAVKYSPRETHVTVSVRGRDGSVQIAVQDQGIGMDQKEVRQIFQKFYRTRKAEESGEAGTGIGLSIVQQIVEQHGGRIDVVSQPGVGSCFTLVVPAVVAERS